MTADATALELESLEPEAEVIPILSVAEIDAEARARFSIAQPRCGCRFRSLTAASLCELYLGGDVDARAWLLTVPVVTRRDALLTLRVLEEFGTDSELASHLLQGLHSHLTAA
jgi:hypothetical protein